MSLSQVINHLNNIKESFYQLLAPKGSHCLTCGKPNSAHVPHFPELCQACYNTIYWIREPRCPVCGRHVGCPDCTRNDDVDDQTGHRHFKLHRSSVAYNAEMREWLGSYKFRGDERYAPLLAKMIVQGAKVMQEELTQLQQRHQFSQFNQSNEHNQSHQTHHTNQTHQSNKFRQFHKFYTFYNPYKSHKAHKLFQRGAFKWDVVTYVPISAERMKERGFNQSYPLANAVAKKLRLPLSPFLDRTIDTDKQSHKNRYQRLHSISSLYQLAPHVGEYIQNLKKLKELKEIQQPLRILLIDDVYTTGSTLNACALALKQIEQDFQIPCEVYGLTWARS